MKNEIKIVSVIRWLARGLNVCLFLFWGAFFLAHLKEWFITPFPDHPPFKVWLSMAWHGLLLAGLLLAWRRERVGSLMILVAGFAFFHGAAGRMFPVFFGLTSLPAFLLLWCWWRTRSRLRAAVSN
jgi:hypothetical protein